MKFSTAEAYCRGHAFQMQPVIVLFIYFCFILFLFELIFCCGLTFGHSQVDNITNPMLIAVFLKHQPKVHLRPQNEVGSLSPAERLFLLLTFLIINRGQGRHET